MIQNLYIGNGWKSPNIHLTLAVLGFRHKSPLRFVHSFWAKDVSRPKELAFVNLPHEFRGGLGREHFWFAHGRTKIWFAP